MPSAWTAQGRTFSLEREAGSDIVTFAEALRRQRVGDSDERYVRRLPKRDAQPNVRCAVRSRTRTQTAASRSSFALPPSLTAHRTLGLRVALGEAPDVTLIAVTHALAAQSFCEGYDVGTLPRAQG